MLTAHSVLQTIMLTAHSVLPLKGISLLAYINETIQHNK